MTCIEMFKKAAVAMQTDERYIELDAARRATMPTKSCRT